MAHNHEFDCKLCGAHLDSKRELDQHNRDRHEGIQASGGNGNQSSRATSSENNPIS